MHTIKVYIEEYTGEGFDNEAMRTLAQDVADYAYLRATALGLKVVPTLATYYRVESDESDRLLDVFEGKAK